MAKALSPDIMPREGDRLADAVALAAKILEDGNQGDSTVVFADSVAPDQIETLREHARHTPINLFAVPAYARGPDPSLRTASSALGGHPVAATLDTAAITELAGRMATGAPLAWPARASAGKRPDTG